MGRLGAGRRGGSGKADRKCCGTGSGAGFSGQARAEKRVKNRFPHCPTSFQTEGKRGTGLSAINTDGYMDETKAVPARFPIFLEPGTGTGVFDGKRVGKRNRPSPNHTARGLLSFDPGALDESARYLPSIGPSSPPRLASFFAVLPNEPCGCKPGRWGPAPRGPTGAR